MITLHMWALGDRGEIGQMVLLAATTLPMPYMSCHSSFQHHSYGTTDPRDQWTYIMSQVPSLFRMAWIKTYQTEEEMNELFGHANNLGINQILLMPYDLSETFVGRVDLAAPQAWYQHWLLRLQKERFRNWCCLNEYFDPNECHIWYEEFTGTTRWAYY